MHVTLKYVALDTLTVAWQCGFEEHARLLNSCLNMETCMHRNTGIHPNACMYACMHASEFVNCRYMISLENDVDTLCHGIMHTTHMTLATPTHKPSFKECANDFDDEMVEEES